MIRKELCTTNLIDGLGSGSIDVQILFCLRKKFGLASCNHVILWKYDWEISCKFGCLHALFENNKSMISYFNPNSTEDFKQYLKL